MATKDPVTHIAIRSFEMAGWEDVADMFLLPNCRWGTLHIPYQSRDDIRRRLETPPPAYTGWWQ
ncbi:MAG: hypothetical protein ACE5G8_14420 [Anaerolineae bacterium]